MKNDSENPSWRTRESCLPASEHMRAHTGRPQTSNLTLTPKIHAGTPNYGRRHTLLLFQAYPRDARFCVTRMRHQSVQATVETNGSHSHANRPRRPQYSKAIPADYAKTSKTLDTSTKSGRVASSGNKLGTTLPRQRQTPPKTNLGNLGSAGGGESGEYKRVALHHKNRWTQGKL